jgi:Flp pilus assembly protein TadB
VSPWIVLAGLLLGSAAALLIRELIPAGPSLRAAIGRLESTAQLGSTGELGSTGQLGTTGQPDGARPVISRTRELARGFRAMTPWLPVPAADLRLLGRETDEWLATKLALGLAGLVAVPLLTALLTLDGVRLPWSFPVVGSVALGATLFLAPDLVTRVNAAEKRRDFRHALMSYLDLVALERGAGAAPTEALEAAASVGGGWAFERIAAALDRARKASRPPWEGLALLASETGIPELADIAEIAGIAGNEGARILDTLSSRAESMRAEALAATKAQAGARNTTMVLPIALLAGGFLILLIFPDFYRVFG